MKKLRYLALGMVVLLILVLVGCDKYEPVKPLLGTADIETVAEPKSQPDKYISDDEPIETIDWITPAKVEVGNLYAGARAECPLTIHNGEDKIRGFTISYRLPDNNLEGYVDAPSGYGEWITIEASSIILNPKETKTIVISLEIPDDAVIVTPKWEYWIVTGESEKGMVTTELACRWLVTMR